MNKGVASTTCAAKNITKELTANLNSLTGKMA